MSERMRGQMIRRLFRNCFLIGRRFRLAHIVFGRKVIETSTFRRQPDTVESETACTKPKTTPSARRRRTPSAVISQ